MDHSVIMLQMLWAGIALLHDYCQRLSGQQLLVRITYNNLLRGGTRAEGPCRWALHRVASARVSCSSVSSETLW